MSNREIKYKKDDTLRLRAKCKGECLWVLYATKERFKTTRVIKTYVTEHICSMVYKNFRVTFTYLADRYLSDWRSEPNMSVNTFKERVKRDSLGDISLWQVYRTKEKVLEKIRGTVVDHYKIQWDYCEKLKRTNSGTTTFVEGYAGEFRRLYVCLGALKEGFIRGCRRVIGLDGFFIKMEYGGQLLSVVGVDANNGMYPVVYAVVEVENGDNWRWFLELLKDDLHIHNGMHWTFISDKQKGLVNAIESLFESVDTFVTAREKPILTMLEEIRVYLMKRIVARREAADRWTSIGLNPLRPPAYTKKTERPKKNRRKQSNEVESSSKAKKSRMSSQNETPSETTSAGISSAKKRAGQTQSCKKCGESGHNSRSCKGGTTTSKELGIIRSFFLVSVECSLRLS
ncbi:uncharacterized protein LOC111403646 [Olea europaea var. sylvestris]|uniref:uncharacterized protein LOC111403646 n=1 Tax=Olea europaea var. sylvestris TaxID=158386 RepID=UPI000C1CFCCF|nr:uncharacterized protein LOC111403646 [Olea europaea var. sylvestris]